LSVSSLSVREIDGVTVVDIIRGSLLLGGAQPEFRKIIGELLKKGKQKILINLANVLYIDSSGIGDLISTYTSARNHSGMLKLLSPQPKLRNLLLITKLDQIFEIFYEEQAAIRSFQA
jgi:anti-sigma B factor antagonist